MSKKKNKRHVNTEPKWQEVENYEGDTILERFKDFESKHKERTTNDILDFVSIENAKLMCELAMNQRKGSSALSEEKEFECLEAWVYIVKHYDGIEEAAYDNWPVQGGALLQRVACTYLQQKIQKQTS